MAETARERQLWEGLLAGLPPDYAAQWEFAYGGDDYNQLYGVPTTPAQQELWRAGQLFPGDPDRQLTAQGLYTGQVEGAQRLDPNAIPDEMRQDYDIWQQRLQVGQAGEDSFNPLGDQFFGALAALALATGGAAAFGGFAAPALAGAEAGAGAIGPLLETGGAFPALAGAADVGGSVLPLAATPTLAAPAGAAGSAALAGGTGAASTGGILGALGLGGGGGGTLATLGDIAGILGPAISGGTSIFGAINAANAAREAARTQAGAAQDANALLWDIHNQNRADLEPYRQAGYASLGQLAGLVDQPLSLPAAFDPSGLGFDPATYAFTPSAGRFTSSQPAFTDPSFAFTAGVPRFTDPSLAFTPPSGQQVLSDDPGYQFRVQQGLKALEGSAAARGGLLSGGTGKALANYGQQAASQEYGAAYNRALGRNVLGYQRAQDQYNRELAENELRYGRTRDQYGRELGENELLYGRERGENELRYGRGLAANERDYARAYQYNTDQANRALAQRNLRFRELGDIAGIGQSATGQGIQLGAQLGGRVGENMLSAGAAQAAGDIGAANALAGGLTGVGNAANKYLEMQFLNQLFRR